MYYIFKLIKLILYDIRIILYDIKLFILLDIKLLKILKYLI